MKNLPDKIYVIPNFDRRWQTKAIDDESIEYINKDTFIEKACDWLRKYVNPIAGTYLFEEDIVKFKNYMKGE